MISGVSFHLTKHKSDANIDGLRKHNERKPGANHSNKNIRDEDTDKNVFLITDDLDMELDKRIDKRLELGYTANRKIRTDAIKLIEGTVEISGDMTREPEEVQEDYLTNSLKWLKERYGADNFLSAVIHKDETNMHLHFDFVPLTEDGRLSAKEVMSRTNLQSVQDDFLKYSQDEYPDVGFVRGDGKSNGMAQKVYERVTADIAKSKADFDAYKYDEYSKLDAKQDRVNKSQSALNNQINVFNTKVHQFNDRVGQWNEQKKQDVINLTARENKVAERETAANEKSTRLNNQAIDLTARGNKLTERETNIETRETAVTKRETDADTRDAQADKRDKMLDEKESRLTVLMDKIKQVADSVASMPKMIRNKVITTFNNYTPIDSEAKAQELVNKLDEDGLTKGLGDINNHNQGRGL